MSCLIGMRSFLLEKDDMFVWVVFFGLEGAFFVWLQKFVEEIWGFQRVVCDVVLVGVSCDWLF